LAYRYLKRVIDIIGAFIAIIIAAVPLVLVAFAVRWSLGRPILFRQERIGRYGQPFHLTKLRTMRDMRTPDGQPLSDEERLTAFGRFLRASSLDELPELWNVLKGDMSLVGPRPLLPEYLPYYSERQMRRHEVRPGLTGLAQVRGRNAISWEARLEADVEYVENLSLALDCEILLRTVATVFAREGISADGHATMPRFDDEMKAKKQKKTHPQTDALRGKES
jgi:lipopolysaccharide/colanic/teichoic acid biosynthesis glycosyltransferase